MTSKNCIFALDKSNITLLKAKEKKINEEQYSLDYSDTAGTGLLPSSHTFN